MRINTLNNFDYQYKKLIGKILNPIHGGVKNLDRTGVGTRSIAGATISLNNIEDCFPLLRLKHTSFNNIKHELLWFMSGDTNIKYLKEHKCNIWNEWADKDGNLGPIYGKQWRDFNGVDQLQNVINSIKQNPLSRRHIVSAWNPSDLDKMALPPCHMMFQFVCNSKDELSIIVTQRSCDVFLGLPYNIASYALLLKIVAYMTRKQTKSLLWTGGDVHLYENHIPQANELMKRRLISEKPQVDIVHCPDNLNNIKNATFRLSNYVSKPSIKADVAV